MMGPVLMGIMAGTSSMLSNVMRLGLEQSLWTSSDQGWRTSRTT
jgi:hypothetical protein